MDCPNGSDEKNCRKFTLLFLVEILFHKLYEKLFSVTLASNINSIKIQPTDTPHLTRYNYEGYVIFNEKGTMGKVCMENLNKTLPDRELETVVEAAAASLCSTLTFS